MQMKTSSCSMWLCSCIYDHIAMYVYAWIASLLFVYFSIPIYVAALLNICMVSILHIISQLCTYVCMHACMHVCTVHTYVCMYVCMNALCACYIHTYYKHVCTFVRGVKTTEARGPEQYLTWGLAPVILNLCVVASYLLIKVQILYMPSIYSAYTFKILLPKICKLLKISTSMAERNFSALQRINTYLRSSMNQARLNHCINCFTCLVVLPL